MSNQKKQEKAAQSEELHGAQAENTEPETGLEPEAPAEEQPEKTEAELLAGQVQELTDKWLRTMAEYDNFRKRSLRERDSIYPEAVASTVTKFLPVYDNFERALACETPEDASDFRKGVEMIFTSFKECMDALGVEEINPEGEAFDPNFHNAVMQVQNPEQEAGTVAMVLQKGYKIGDRILRHAMVQVVCE